MKVVHSADNFVELAQNAIRSATHAFIPGRYWVDYMPLLRYMPAWIPGAGFRHKAAECRAQTEAIIELPFATVRSSTASSTPAAAYTDAANVC